MGWLWSTTTDTPSLPSSLPTDEIPAPPQIPSKPVTAAQNAPPSKPLSRDEIAEQELHSFLQELSADTKPSSTKYNRVGRAAPPTSSNLSTSTDINEPLSEQLLPTTMSCRVAFDEAFYCNSFGGKFNDLYRYGGLKSCSENWSKFWFCMRTRTWSENEKRKAIKEHYRNREHMRYGRDEGKKLMSSEDIWRSRDKKVKWGDGNFDAVVPGESGNDEKWNIDERARRAKAEGENK